MAVGEHSDPRGTKKGFRSESSELRRGHTGREAREDREERVDPVTVAATSRTDRSRVIVLLVNTPASEFIHFARCLSVSSGLESMRFALVKLYVSGAARFNGSETHVFRACGDSLMCPLSKGMMLPVSRCDT